VCAIDTNKVFLTRISQSSAPHSEMTAFTIGVVGAPECGKTTLIRKGLKAWSVGEETIRDAVTPYGRLRCKWVLFHISFLILIIRVQMAYEKSMLLVMTM